MPYFENVDTYKKLVQQNAGHTGLYWLYERWTYTEITILPALTNMYEKISTIVMLTLPDFFQGRSTGAEVNGLTH
jgi:hypothetical protein